MAADGSRNYQLWSPDVREACQLRSEIRLVWASWVSEEQDLLVRRPAGVKGVGRSQIRRRGHRSVNCILTLRPHLCLCSYLFKLTHLYNLVERC